MKRIHTIASVALAAAALVGCKTTGGQGSQSFSIEARTVNARANDRLASKYILSPEGKLSFVSKDGSTTCYVYGYSAVPVRSIKGSSHPNDAAGLYFEVAKDDGSGRNDLWYVKQSDWRGVCPAYEEHPVQKLMDTIQKYNIVATTQTTVVNVGLDYYGSFRAWDNNASVFNAEWVADYSFNDCYGQEGKSFSSYLAFLKMQDGSTIKLNGLNPADSKSTDESYEELVPQICKEQGQGGGNTPQACNSDWNGYFNAKKDAKVGILKNMFKGIGQSSAEKIVACNGFGSKPKSWDVFMDMIHNIESSCGVSGLSNNIGQFEAHNKAAIGCR